MTTHTYKYTHRHTHTYISKCVTELGYGRHCESLQSKKGKKIKYQPCSYETSSLWEKYTINKKNYIMIKATKQ